MVLYWNCDLPGWGQGGGEQQVWVWYLFFTFCMEIEQWSWFEDRHFYMTCNYKFHLISGDIYSVTPLYIIHKYIKCPYPHIFTSVINARHNKYGLHDLGICLCFCIIYITKNDNVMSPHFLWHLLCHTVCNNNRHKVIRLSPFGVFSEYLEAHDVMYTLWNVKLLIHQICATNNTHDSCLTHVLTFMIFCLDTAKSHYSKPVQQFILLHLVKGSTGSYSTVWTPLIFKTKKTGWCWVLSVNMFVI